MTIQNGRQVADALYEALGLTHPQVSRIMIDSRYDGVPVVVINQYVPEDDLHRLKDSLRQFVLVPRNDQHRDKLHECAQAVIRWWDSLGKGEHEPPEISDLRGQVA